MTTIEPYRPPQDVTAFPLRLDVNGATYILAQGDGHQKDQFAHQQTLIPHPIPLTGPILNGVQQMWTPQGYQPYHAHQDHPPWLRNHYTRGTGMLIGAACIGTLLFIVGAALYMIATWALAHLIAIGIAVLLLFFGLMALLGAITNSRHGHKPFRGR